MAIEVGDLIWVDGVDDSLINAAVLETSKKDGVDIIHVVYATRRGQLVHSTWRTDWVKGCVVVSFGGLIRVPRSPNKGPGGRAFGQ